MNDKTREQIEAMKMQTIGVEVEMNNITREKAARYEGRWAECPKPTATDTDEELELSDAQCARNDEIYNAAYEFCKVMAEDDRLEWNMEILGELADLAAELLTRHGSRVRYPAVVTEPDGRQYIEEYHGGIK